jgi:hypothetical protein
MSLPYVLRLLCISFSAFYLIHAVAAAGVGAVAPMVIRSAGGMRAGSAARLLFAMRMIPVGVAGFVVVGLCVPSYLWLEPRAGVEQVGWVCIGLALLGSSMCLRAGGRMGRAGLGSLRFGRFCARNGRVARIGGQMVPVTVVELKFPLLAVVGMIRRRLVVSNAVLQALSEEELDTALQHEHAHWIWGDNFKRLLFLATPRGFFLSRGLEAMEREWAKSVEWAADDYAAQGEPERAVTLAAALVRVARMGSGAPDGVVLSQFADSENLSVRVERLLQVTPERVTAHSRMSAKVAAVAALGACLGAVLMMIPGTLIAVHALLERLID